MKDFPSCTMKAVITMIDGPYQCKYCGLPFDTKQGYCQHLSLVHGIDSREDRLDVLDEQGYLESKHELREKINILESKLQGVKE